jgi:hypothetical protein
VGPRSDRQALDATERLVFNAAMSGLGWLEGIAAEGDSPIKRLLAVQYRMVGAMLGLDGDAVGRDAGAAAAAAADSAAPQPAQPTSDATRSARAPGGLPGPVPVHVVLGSAADRAVTVLAWDASVPRIKAALTFHHAELPIPAGQPRPEGTFERTDANAVLHVRVPAEIRPGRWRAAICDAARTQVGWMDIGV